ncbi:MAG TPA: penicillin-binding protein 1C, partial [Rhodanobacteraceae bacterium]
GGVHAPKPASVRAEDICWPLGGAAAATEPTLCRQHRHAWVLNDALPPTFVERGPGAWIARKLVLRVDAKGRRLSGGCHGKGEHEAVIARWPALLAPWLSVDDRKQEALPPLAPGCAADALERASVLRISGLDDEAILRRAPNSDKPLRITLRALGAQGPVQWLLDGRLQAHSESDRPVTLTFGQPGQHALTALAGDGGWDSVGFSVLAAPGG